MKYVDATPLVDITDITCQECNFAHAGVDARIVAITHTRETGHTTKAVRTFIEQITPTTEGKPT